MRYLSFNLKPFLGVVYVGDQGNGTLGYHMVYDLVWLGLKNDGCT